MLLAGAIGECRAQVHNTGRFSQLLRPLAVAVALLLAAFAVPAFAGPPYPFDDSGYLGNASLMPDWAATMAREQQQAAALDACLASADACPRHYRGLRHLLIRAAEFPVERQIRLVNHYVNRKRYRGDRTGELASPLTEETLRYRSRWATVEEFLTRGGDCEDYATTKYYLLRRLGIPADQLRVVVAWDRSERAYHAILAVKRDGVIRLLDSNDEIIRGGHHRYRFIYSFNEHSIWDHERDRAAASRTFHQQEEPSA